MESSARLSNSLQVTQLLSDETNLPSKPVPIYPRKRETVEARGGRISRRAWSAERKEIVKCSAFICSPNGHSNPVKYLLLSPFSRQGNRPREKRARKCPQGWTTRKLLVTLNGAVSEEGGCGGCLILTSSGLARTSLSEISSARRSCPR